jgi:hypothetical protein
MTRGSDHSWVRTVSGVVCGVYTAARVLDTHGRSALGLARTTPHFPLSAGLSLFLGVVISFLFIGVYLFPRSFSDANSLETYFLFVRAKSVSLLL